MSWLGTWKNRIKLTIDQTKVDAALSDFPVLIKLSSSSGIGTDDLTAVFDELASDANRKKIAVTTSNETTQCYVEIERWDDANELAWLWVKVPSVAHDADTILYLYYDSAQADNSTYVGDTTDAAAKSVWDANFQLVVHMGQAPAGASSIKDSTTNVRHGTSVNMESGDMVDGKVAKGLDFDGSNEYVDWGDLFYSDIITIEALINPDSITDYHSIVVKNNSSGVTHATSMAYRFMLATATNRIFLAAWNSSAATVLNFGSSNDAVSTGSWQYVACVMAGNGNESYLHANNAVVGSATQSGAIRNDTNRIQIGARTNDDNDRYFPGLMDEVRISSVVRSEAWRTATYYTCFDTFITAGPFEVYEAVSIEAEAEPAWSMQSSLTPVDLSAEADSAWSMQSSLTPVDLSAEAEPAWLSEGIYQRESEPSAEASGAWARNGIFLGENEIGVEAESEWGVYNLSQFLAANGDGIVRRYYFTLTGAEDGEDDVMIPISSFSARLRDTDPTYLGVVIPGTDHADEISARPNGQMVIDQAWVVGGVEAYREEIARADLEDIRTDEGARNQSITLSGHRSETFVAKIASLTGASYKYMSEGKLRYRCLPDLYVRPGDTVRINNDEFTAGLITINVNALQQTMEIAEE